jgi:hypothetical protein
MNMLGDLLIVVVLLERFPLRVTVVGQVVQEINQHIKTRLEYCACMID